MSTVNQPAAASGNKTRDPVLFKNYVADLKIDERSVGFLIRIVQGFPLDVLVLHVVPTDCLNQLHCDSPRIFK
jgi:hypothetical protein